MKELASEFTMGEYIAHHGLNVSVHDRAATAIISAHLRKKGYVKVRKRHNGVPRYMWTKRGTGVHAELAKKLKEL